MKAISEEGMNKLAFPMSLVAWISNTRNNHIIPKNNVDKIFDSEFGNNILHLFGKSSQWKSNLYIINPNIYAIQCYQIFFLFFFNENNIFSHNVFWLLFPSPNFSQILPTCPCNNSTPSLLSLWKTSRQTTKQENQI